MKNNAFIKISSALLLSLTLLLSSCSSSESPVSSEKSVTQNIVNNTVTIENTGEGNIAYASSSGLRSAVSIYCTFETTVGGSSFWNPTPQKQTYYTTGSGVIYSLDTDGNAFIVTNHHVVYDSDSNTDNGISEKIYIYLYGYESEEYAIPAYYVGGSANYDLAVLRVDSSNVLKSACSTGGIAAVSIADSNEITPGATAIAIGNPSASELSGISVTSGIVSVDSEYITMTSSAGSGEVSFRVIRTDAPVNSGNSGGGLYNDRGELIGIVNAKISSSSVENIGYAIPSSVVRAISDNIIDYCYEQDCESVMRAIVGITLEISSYSTVYDTETGLLKRVEEVSIYDVSSGGIGENILKVGDIVTSVTINDKTTEVTRQYHLIDAMLDARVGDTVTFGVLRDGEEISVSVTITEDCLTAY